MSTPHEQPSRTPSSAPPPTPVSDLSPVTSEPVVEEQVTQERYALLEQLEDWLEGPMLVLGFFWLVLLVVELLWSLSPGLQMVGSVIWVLFIVDFVIKLVLAPERGRYIAKNWLTVIALLVPALRVFRVARFVRVLRMARATRGLSLLRVVSSLNRGMKALGRAMSRRGFGYVVLLTVIVAVVGAAGMFFFERNQPEGPGFGSYSNALWWTAMLMTTLGSGYWPESAEGRILCFLLSLYAFAVFGYVTATLATFFIGRDAEDEEAELASAKAVARLQRDVDRLLEALQVADGPATGAAGSERDPTV
jgi:voltage-gated potassium channel